MKRLTCSELCSILDLCGHVYDVLHVYIKSKRSNGNFDALAQKIDVESVHDIVANMCKKAHLNQPFPHPIG